MPTASFLEDENSPSSKLLVVALIAYLGQDKNKEHGRDGKDFQSKGRVERVGKEQNRS